MYLERSNVDSIHIYGVKCVLTGNDISDDLQPIRKYRVQGRGEFSGRSHNRPVRKHQQAIILSFILLLLFFIFHCKSLYI